MRRDRFNILVLHNVEDVAVVRESTWDFIAAFERNAPEHSYLYHRITLPLTPTLKQTPWDVIILDSTALGIVTFRPRSKYDKIKISLQFLSSSDAVKIMMPQDDYNHSAVLDDLFVQLCADIVYTPLIEHADVLYPRSRNRCEILGALTGYVEATRIVQRRAFAKPFEARQRLIGQRVTYYPERGGRFSRIKGDVAEIVKRVALSRGLAADISTDDSAVFYGDDWFRFLGDCKFALSSESGVSLHDPHGDIMDAIAAFKAVNSQASFEEVEAACFAGLDGQRIFSALSPRVFEVAMIGCCQVLTEGTYSGVLQPNVHYIPLKTDGSNAGEVLDRLADVATAKLYASAAYDHLIASGRFTYGSFVEEALGRADRILSKRRKGGRQVERVDIAKVRPQYLAELRDALVLHAQQDEGMYEPYLVPWIQKLLQGQLTNDADRKAVGSDDALRWRTRQVLVAHAVEVLQNSTTRDAASERYRPSQGALLPDIAKGRLAPWAEAAVLSCAFEVPISVNGRLAPWAEEALDECGYAIVSKTLALANEKPATVPPLLERIVAAGEGPSSTAECDRELIDLLRANLNFFTNARGGGAMSGMLERVLRYVDTQSPDGRISALNTAIRAVAKSHHWLTALTAIRHRKPPSAA